MNDSDLSGLAKRIVGGVYFCGSFLIFSLHSTAVIGLASILDGCLPYPAPYPPSCRGFPSCPLPVTARRGTNSEHQEMPHQLFWTHEESPFQCLNAENLSTTRVAHPSALVIQGSVIRLGHSKGKRTLYRQSQGWKKVWTSGIRLPKSPRRAIWEKLLSVWHRSSVVCSRFGTLCNACSLPFLRVHRHRQI